MSVAETLPSWMTEVVAPGDEAGVQEALREAAATRTAVYPLGGGTSLDYGLTPTRAGWGLATTGLKRVIDYPARDLVVSVEAGITLAELAEVLRSEGQRLPIEVPDAATATLGGAMATNWSGPARFGQGTLRDYVIGVAAVDGRGSLYHGGGRVVKNVAGYDFCKLLTGSLGTLGVITQVNLKVKPLAEATAWIGHDLPDLEAAERLLDALPHSNTTPTAVELLAGASCREFPGLPAASGATAARLLIGLEGTADEVDWMLPQLEAEWRPLGARAVYRLRGEEGAEAARALTGFSRHGLGGAEEAALSLKLNVVPSATTRLCRQLLEMDATAEIACHAGNGIIFAHLKRFTTTDVAGKLVRQLQPMCAAAGGNVVVLAARGVGELTRQAVWGVPAEGSRLMADLSAAFDPQGILNPGRFVYGRA